MPGIVFNPTERGPRLRAHRHRRRLPLERVDAAVDSAARLDRLRRLEPDRRRQPGDRSGRPEPPLRPRRHVHERVDDARTARSCARPTAARPSRAPTCPSSRAATCPAATWASGSPSIRTATRRSTSARAAATASGARPTSAPRWARVTSFPAVGTYVQDPNDPNGYLTDRHRRHLGHVRPAHDRHRPERDRRRSTSASPTSAPASTAAPTAGATWAALAGPAHRLPAAPRRPRRRTASSTSRTANKGGPYDGEKGDVWKYDTATVRLDADQPRPLDERRRLLRLRRPRGRRAGPGHA